MDIGVFDNFDEDGQLTLFGLEEDFGDFPEPLGGEAQEISEKPGAERESVRGEAQGIPDAAETGGQSGRRSGPELSGELPDGQATGIRIRRCSSCGKLLFVREENGGWYSSCNACGIQYVQK